MACAMDKAIRKVKADLHSEIQQVRKEANATAEASMCFCTAHFESKPSEDTTIKRVESLENFFGLDYVDTKKYPNHVLPVDTEDGKIWSILAPLVKMKK